MDRNVIETGEDGVTKWNPMSTWVNDSFSQIAGVKGGNETGTAFSIGKGVLKWDGLVNGDLRPSSAIGRHRKS